MAMFFDVVEMTFQTSPGENRVPLTNDEYIELLDGRSLGFIIVIDEITGRPKLALPPVPDITPYDVNVERDRRIYSGFIFNQIEFDSDEQSIRRVTTNYSLACNKITEAFLTGDLRWADASIDFHWIAADNSEVFMDAQTFVHFAEELFSWERKHVYKARELKALTPIPRDYKEDIYWS